MLFRSNRIKSEGAQVTLGYISPWQTPGSNRHEDQPQSFTHTTEKVSIRHKQRIIHQLQFGSAPRKRKQEGSPMLHTIGDFKQYMRDMAKEEAGTSTHLNSRKEQKAQDSLQKLFKKKCVSEFKNVAKVISIGEFIEFEPTNKQTSSLKPMARPIPPLRKSLQASRKQPRPYRQTSDSRTKARSITQALVCCMKKRKVQEDKKQTLILNKTLQSFLNKQHQV